ENGLRALVASPPLNAADASSVARRTGTLTRNAPPGSGAKSTMRAAEPWRKRGNPHRDTTTETVAQRRGDSRHGKQTAKPNLCVGHQPTVLVSAQRVTPPNRASARPA